MSPVCWNARWSITYLPPRVLRFRMPRPETRQAGAPRFGADDEHAARGALRALIRVLYVLLAQLCYEPVLVLYALAHIHCLEDGH